MNSTTTNTLLDYCTHSLIGDDGVCLNCKKEVMRLPGGAFKLRGLNNLQPPPRATRDSEDEKLDFDGSFSPLVMLRFARYMQSKKNLPDGSVRSCGDWKAGMSRKRYFRSLWRHHMDVALLLHGHVADGKQDDLEEALLAVMFNAQGMLLEVLLGREVAE